VVQAIRVMVVMGIWEVMVVITVALVSTARNV
jgi:hypothetical protein